MKKNITCSFIVSVLILKKMKFLKFIYNYQKRGDKKIEYIIKSFLFIKIFLYL